MNENIAVSFKNVTKGYKLNKKEKNKIFNLLFNKKNIKKKVVLDSISFDIKTGSSVAILGKNGMGKSTILKLLSGISYPTSGDIIVNGSIGSILELNAGFENEFTGRENIYLKCQILGLKPSEIKKIEPKIVDFADIGEYIDEPVRTYSSGMRARLGFAISIHMNPDILAVDEVFSVGDYKFREKCLSKVKEIISNKHTTFILVTHSCQVAKEFCDTGILLNNGKILFNGDIDQCVEAYLKL